MDSSYSHTSNSNSSSSSSSIQYQQEEKSGKPVPNYRYALHCVRKNIIMKKPIAPMPPTPPKVYKVDRVDFKDVVQKLTGAIEFQPTRLQEVAPPPLSLSASHRLPIGQNSSSANNNMQPFSTGKATVGFETDSQGEKHWNSFDQSNFGSLTSPLGFMLSPSSLAWCSSILLSPGNLSSLGPSKVI